MLDSVPAYCWSLQARLRALADAVNEELSAVAEDEGVVEWPPLHGRDVSGWWRSIIRVTKLSKAEVVKVKSVCNLGGDWWTCHQNSSLYIFLCCSDR